MSLIPQDRLDIRLHGRQLRHPSSPGDISPVLALTPTSTEAYCPSRLLFLPPSFSLSIRHAFTFAMSTLRTVQKPRAEGQEMSSWNPINGGRGDGWEDLWLGRAVCTLVPPSCILCELFGVQPYSDNLISRSGRFSHGSCNSWREVSFRSRFHCTRLTIVDHSLDCRRDDQCLPPCTSLPPLTAPLLTEVYSAVSAICVSRGRRCAGI